MQVLSFSDLFSSPLALLAIPVLASVIIGDAITFAAVTSIMVVGGIEAAGLPSDQQYLLIGALVTIGTVLNFHRLQIRRTTTQSVEDLREELAELRLTVNSIRNIVEHARLRTYTIDRTRPTSDTIPLETGLSATTSTENARH